MGRHRRLRVAAGLRPRRAASGRSPSGPLTYCPVTETNLEIVSEPWLLLAMSVTT
jgi:hypothetical protein